MNIIVAFAKTKDIQIFKSILFRGGYETPVTASAGVQALSAMDDLGSGVIICGYRLTDMLYSELLEDLPPYFKMLMISSPAHAPSAAPGDNFIYLQTPLNTDDFFSTLTLMLEGVSTLRKREKKKRLQRSEADKKVIERAKEILQQRHCMTEPEAHRYLQKCSMDSGTDLLETAEMIISLTNI